jgi:pyruvate/2-oxoglutarate dehydrogenase complex dihydrolipoamide dehydrogenase (E3) component
VDFGRVMEWVRETRERVYAHETPEVLAAEGVEVIEAEARFEAPGRLRAGARQLGARAFVVATGARALRPELPGLDAVRHVTHEELFELRERPERLAVVGAGPIGVEMAQAFARLGSRVSILASRVLPTEEPAASRLVRESLERDGVVFVKERARRLEALPDGASRVHAGTAAVDADLVLVATGRRPRYEGLGLEEAGVALEAGAPVLDGGLRSGRSRIYFAGDATGGPQFSHLAGWLGFLAARNALLPFSGRSAVPALPRTTFTAPELGRVGPTEAEARERFGRRVGVAVRGLDRVDRAVCDGATDGFLKLVHVSGRLVGGTIVSERAGETTAELALAVHRRLRLRDLGGAIHPYPTYATALQQVAGEAAAGEVLRGPLGALIRALAGRVR